MRVGVVVFPGSNCDRDALHVARLAGAEAVPLWHEDPDTAGADLVVLPEGSRTATTCGRASWRGSAP